LPNGTFPRPPPVAVAGTGVLPARRVDELRRRPGPARGAGERVFGLPGRRGRRCGGAGGAPAGGPEPFTAEGAPGTRLPGARPPPPPPPAARRTGRAGRRARAPQRRRRTPPLLDPSPAGPSVRPPAKAGTGRAARTEGRPSLCGAGPAAAV